MTVFDLGDAHLQKIDPEEFSQVRQICEEALNSTFISSTGRTELSGDEGDSGPNIIEEAFLDGKGVIYKLMHGCEMIGGVFIRFVSAEIEGSSSSWVSCRNIAVKAWGASLCAK